jgi:hypothetical protein
MMVAEVAFPDLVMNLTMGKRGLPFLSMKGSHARRGLSVCPQLLNVN